CAIESSAAASRRRLSDKSCKVSAIPEALMVRTVRVVCAVVVCAAPVLAACGGSSAATPGSKALPTVALVEAGAVPLPSHVASKDLASGAYDFERVRAAGSALFHTSFNGADGVGISVRPTGARVGRFAPLGPQGPNAQSCGECHNAPIPSAGGLAHSS